MSLKDLQNELDIQKWKLSEQENKDKCGELAYCGSCNKSVEFPCAEAYNKAAAKAAKPAVKKPAVKAAAPAAKKPAAKKSK